MNHHVKVRGLILDIDGTLLDSNDAHAGAYQKAFKENGFLVPYELIRKKIGMGSDKLFPLLVGIEDDSDKGKQIKKDKNTIFKSEYQPKLQAFPKSKELIEAIYKRGIKLAVATSASEKDCKAFLDIIGIRKRIHKIITADDVNQSKPSSDPVSKSLEKLGLKPSEVLMIGDTPYDIEAASKASVKTIAFRSGGWSDEKLSASVMIYENPEDLLNHLVQSPIFTDQTSNLDTGLVPQFASNHSTTPFKGDSQMEPQQKNINEVESTSFVTPLIAVAGLSVLAIGGYFAWINRARIRKFVSEFEMPEAVTEIGHKVSGLLGMEESKQIDSKTNNPNMRKTG